ncbi:MAG TPA: hypothetical protein DCG49_06585 [Ruminococcus sp.]|nr:hypothetical protein [Ruminococcus sp.]
MKADTFMNAVGLINDRFLDIEVPVKRIAHRKQKKRIAAIAAVAVLITCSLPTLTAFGFEPAYMILYHIAPSAAQTFKPVQKTCADNGIEMTVISAERSGSEASVYLAMRDITGTCPDGDWDLFDSYSINVPRDMSGHCSFSEYDADTHTAYFVVHLQTTDGSSMPKGKVTFSVCSLLCGKENQNGELTALDLSSVPKEPETMYRTNIVGIAGNKHGDFPKPEDYRFLVPAETPLLSPISGVSVMGIGYTDGALHILTKYEDVNHTDNHGNIDLCDRAGNRINEKEWIVFNYRSDDSTPDRKNYCCESIFPIEYDKLKDCTLYGSFVTAQQYVSGNWQITFPLK